MKYLELFTASVRDELPENLMYHRYHPANLQNKYFETEGYAGFNIFDQRLADKFNDRTGLVETFQGYRTLDKE